MPFYFHIPPEPYFWDVIAYIWSQLPTLGDAGLSGHYLSCSDPAALNGTLGTGMYGSMVLLSHDTAEAEDLLYTLNETIRAHWPVGGIALQKESPTLYDSFIN